MITCWISVKDKLPKVIVKYRGFGTKQSVRVLVVNGRNITIAHCEQNEDDGEACWFEDDTSGSILFNVTHWMPLPELPKEK